MIKYNCNVKSNIPEVVDCYDKNGKFISKKCTIKLSCEGKGKIIFNTANFAIYTIVVQNMGLNSVFGIMGVSPDNVSFTYQTEEVEVTPGAIQTFLSSVFLKYTSIEVTGEPNTLVTIFFQGQI